MHLFSAPHLDPTTLVFAIGVLGLIMGGVSLAASKSMPAQRSSLASWSKSMLSAGGGFMLLFLQGHAATEFTFLMAHTLIIACAAYCLIAHAQIFDLRLARGSVTGVSAFGMSGVLAAHLFDAPLGAALSTLAAAVAFHLGRSAAILMRHSASQPKPSVWISTATLGALAAASAVRTAIGLAGDTAMVSPAATSSAQIGALLAGTLFIVATSVGFLSLAHDRQRREILENARRDGLTGLLTRSAFFESATAIDLLRTPEPYAVVMIDIDHFKIVNDTFGHSGGDATLAHAARLVASAVRISDLVGRYGGEEFCVLLRGCGEPEAAHLAQRLVAQASQQTVRLRDGRHARFTLSAGYASRHIAPARPAPEAVMEVIERADQALYRAKRAGRNQALAALPLTLQLHADS